MRDYLTREAAIGLRVMLDTNRSVHVFDVGTDTAGNEWVFVQAVLPKEQIEKTLGPVLLPSDLEALKKASQEVEMRDGLQGH